MTYSRSIAIPMLASALLLSLAAGPDAAPTTAPSVAAGGGAVHLVISKPQTPLTDALFSLSKQTGVTIVTDDTVTGTLDPTTIDKPTLPQTLDALAALSPGLTWQRINLPPDASLPDGNALSAQVRALATISATHLLVTNPAAGSALRFSKTNAQDPSLSTRGMQTVYLVTNETVRARRTAQPAPAPGPAANTPGAPLVDQAVSGMKTTADQFSQMTPAQQQQAIPLLFQQFQRMYQSMDPSVRAQLGQQWQNGGQGPNEMPGQNSEPQQ